MIVTGALNLVLWPYYQMTTNKLFIWPFTICTKHLQKIGLGIVSNVTLETQLLWRLCGEFWCLAYAPRHAYIFWQGQLWKLLRNFVFLKILFVHDLLYLILSLTCVYDLFINQPCDWRLQKIKWQCCLLKFIYQLLT